ncbi:MAG: phosphotransferase enzyme family protein [Acidobacteriota bacterium]
MKSPGELELVVRRFQTGGAFTGAQPFSGGHIHDSYCVVVDACGERKRFLLQRLNTHVFPDADALMENVARVTAHVAACVAGQPDAARRALQLVPAGQGFLHRDGEGGCWRMFRWIEGTHAPDRAETAAQALRMAQAFGRFQQQLSTLPGPRLHEPIPGFHETPRRFAALEQAIAADAAARVAESRREIEFALTRKPMAAQIVNAGLPERVAHYDPKPSNVLVDDATGEALCVIDLDTVMRGLAVYDFGDMVRAASSPTAEDERDLARVEMHMELFEALARGYLSTAGGFLTRAEKDHLVLAGKLITFENGLRFLADYLNGDTYYKTERAGQNLDRCRTHFKLVESIEQQEDAMRRVVEELS